MTEPSTAAICVFCKPPVPGISKTRLAADIGPERAVALAKAFVEDTWRAVARLPATVAVLAVTVVEKDAFAFVPDAPLWEQGAGDLGERLERVLRRALDSADVAIVAPWFDVDDALGLELLRERLRTGEIAAPSTAAVLDGWELR